MNQDLNIFLVIGLWFFNKLRNPYLVATGLNIIAGRKWIINNIKDYFKDKS